MRKLYDSDTMWFNKYQDTLMLTISGGELTLQRGIGGISKYLTTIQCSPNLGAINVTTDGSISSSYVDVFGDHIQMSVFNTTNTNVFNLYDTYSYSNKQFICNNDTIGNTYKLLKYGNTIINNGILTFNSNNKRVSNTFATLDTSGIRLLSNTTCYNDLFFPFTLGVNSGTGYPIITPDSGYYYFVVDTTGPSKCIMYFITQMPHNWKEGSMIYPHVHYKHTTTNGIPTFKMKYKIYNINGTTDKGWKWYTMDKTTGTINNTMQMCYANNGIDITGYHISNIIVFQIYLTDKTGSGGIYAYQFDIHYEIDSFGSSTLTHK